MTNVTFLIASSQETIEITHIVPDVGRLLGNSAETIKYGGVIATPI